MLLQKSKSLKISSGTFQANYVDRSSNFIYIKGVMNTTANTIINDYIRALSERAEQAGDGRLDYAMGFLEGSLKYLKLQSSDLESLQFDTKNLIKLASQNNQ